MKAKSWKKLLPQSAAESEPDGLNRVQELLANGDLESVVQMSGGEEKQRLQELLEERKTLEARMATATGQPGNQDPNSRERAWGTIPSLSERRKQVRDWEEKREKALEKARALRESGQVWDRKRIQLKEKARSKMAEVKEKAKVVDRFEKALEKRDEKLQGLKDRFSSMSDLDREMEKRMARRLQLDQKSKGGMKVVKDKWEVLRNKQKEAMQIRQAYQAKVARAMALKQVRTDLKSLADKQEKLKERALEKLKQRQMEARKEEERFENRRLRKKKDPYE